MKKIKGVTIITLAIITLFFNDNVKAYTASAVTDGDSYEAVWEACGENMVGCATWSTDFIVRVTLIDKNKNRVAGTDTIEIYPNNPDKSDGSYKYLGSNTEQDYNMKLEPSEIGKINFNDLYKDTKENKILIKGSNTAKNATGMYKKYQINMGIGPSEIEEDFENYKTIREKFIRYVTKSSESNSKKIKVWDNSEKKYKRINFIDFFLKESGFTNTWEASTDPITRQKLSTNDYYLLIEPVYSYGVYNKNGKLQLIRGTSKELAEVMYGNTAQMGDNPWFWVAFEPKIAYNHYCNFIEKGETKLFSSDKSSRCGDISSFELYTQQLKEEISGTPGADGFLGGLFSGLKTLLTTMSFALDKAQSIHGDMKDSNSNVGINIINISDTLRDIPYNKVVENDCELVISNCEGNSYVFSSKLSAKDPAACVFPKYSNDNKDQLENSELNKIVYTSNSTNQQQKLWCYDDVTYDFKDLKNYMMAHKYITTTQLLQIPAGKLTVTRTCYSAEKNNNIDSVFKTDPAITDKRYLEKVPFKIGNNPYDYKLDKTKYQIKDGKKITSNFETEVTETQDGKDSKIKYYTYKQTFNYDYILDAGTTVDNNYLGIKDLQISAANQTISIKLDGNSNSKVIQNPINNNGETVNGRISFGEGLGLSYNIFDSFNKYTTTTVTKNSARTVTKYTTTQNYSLATAKNTYIRNRGNANACEFMTTTAEKNIEFRVIDLANPFPGRDGTSRIPGEEWISKVKNNVYNYIQNNRGVTDNKVYDEDPLYVITLTPSAMVDLREYNKNNDYSYASITCDSGTGRKCVSSIVHDSKYLTGGTCKDIKAGADNNSFYECAEKDSSSGG